MEPTVVLDGMSRCIVEDLPTRIIKATDDELVLSFWPFKLRVLITRNQNDKPVLVYYFGVASPPGFEKT